MNNTTIQNDQDDKATLALGADKQADVLLTAYEEIWVCPT
jgi:predicted nucleic acid-binding protein